MNISFEDWLELCPDRIRFLTEFVDVKADIEHVMNTYEEFASIKEDAKPEITQAVLDQFYNQDWSDHNNFIAYLISEEID